MLIFRKRRFGLPYTTYWFADKPSLQKALLPCIYLQSGHSDEVVGYARRVFQTKLIDLRQTPEELLKGMNESTAYKVRRAMRDGVVLERVSDLDRFLEFYNGFASSKERERLTSAQIDGWGEQTIAVAAMQNGEALAMHSYVVDPQRSRARLLHSASLFRNLDDSASRNAVSRANSCLHYQSMLLFREAGLTYYDMGGYAAGSADAELANIARFKDGFGGVVVQESNYTSWPMIFLQGVLSLRRKAGKSPAAA